MSVLFLRELYVINYLQYTLTFFIRAYASYGLWLHHMIRLTRFNMIHEHKSLLRQDI